ncbi:MAG: DMT family transporter [Flavobacteriales bacterium]|jgi:drug/metabolite transporter (DMT)-like permease|nr:DMT family transporter [Flavobacteriales bacterium]
MKNLIKKYRFFLLLHLTVLIWGFTGVLGKLISVGAIQTTAFRTGIAFLSLLLFQLYSKKRQFPETKKMIQYLGIGCLIGLHWYAFFESIEVSNVSIALTCLASASLFVSILDPLINKTSIKLYELILGIVVIIGISIIFSFESEFAWGIILGLITAFLGALFTIINGRLIARGDNSVTITLYEMLGALGVVIFFSFFRDGHSWQWDLPINDWVYLLILGTVCTAFAFMLGIYVMKEISPFTLTISVNLEPIYAIILALILFGEEEVMTKEFYFGGIIILGSIFANALIKSKINKKKKV